MLARSLYPIAFSPEWGRQMRFITGPRQSGKTTLAKMKLAHEKNTLLYYLWDMRSVRNQYKNSELFFTADAPPSKKKQWICFDELHKMPKWKNMLKGIYDSSFEHYFFIITGSSKFDISRRAGDSLAGRAFTFHLYPLSLTEVMQKKSSFVLPKTAVAFIENLLAKTLSAQKQKGLESLIEYGGFPEPFVKQSKRFQSKWRQDYLDVVIKEDVGALTNIIARENLYDLYRLLPEMVGNPLSQTSLASHLETSLPTVKNYLKHLENFYLAFRIYPYAKNIKRSLLKTPKMYLYDWTSITNPGTRFENYVAVELKTLTSLWADATGEQYSLFYIRNKQKQESDFLVTKNDLPWCLFETKLSDSPIERHHLQTQTMLANIPFVQICFQKNISLLQTKNAYRVSAARFFS